MQKTRPVEPALPRVEKAHAVGREAVPQGQAAGLGLDRERGGVAPYDAFFGSRYAIVFDPDGNQVGIKSPIEADRKYVPEL